MRHCEQASHKDSSILAAVRAVLPFDLFLVAQQDSLAGTPCPRGGDPIHQAEVSASAATGRVAVRRWIHRAVRVGLHSRTSSFFGQHFVNDEDCRRPFRSASLLLHNLSGL